MRFDFINAKLCCRGLPEQREAFANVMKRILGHLRLYAVCRAWDSS